MNNTFEKQVGNKIKTLRESKKLTQEQLSAKLQVNGCDITRSALAKIEVGQRHIYIDELILFKEILETSYEELLERLCV
ncbi:MAG: helix-turn-helix transcriptional regulator [Lachnospiraceae bacterium]|nr:helix-turn-helix transcriptional regulator [Lachnospiraceae bacterium]